MSPATRAAPVAAAQAAFGRGAYAEALRVVSSLLADTPGALPARHVAALALKRLGRLGAASRETRRTLALAPGNEACLLNLADLLRRQRRYGPARRVLAAVLAGTPWDADVRATLAAVLVDAGSAVEAAHEGRRAVAVAPDRALAWYNLSAALGARFRYTESAAALERAWRLDPRHHWSHHNLGVARRWLGAPHAAIAALRRALALTPVDATIRFHHAQALLSGGRLAEGWAEFAWRWHTDRHLSERRTLPRPEWAGETGDLTVMVWREQGIGDEIIFGTCLPDLMRRVRHVVVECDARLVPLLSRSLPGLTARPTTIAADGRETRVPPDYDRQVPIAGLPRHLRRSLSAFPESGAYLRADPGETARWRAWAESLGAGRKVGLCWRSHWQNPDRDRYFCRAEEIVDLLSVPGCRFVCLQYDARDTELATLAARAGATIHVPPGLDQKQEIDRTAALLSALDTIVAPATSVAVLAGALGCDTRMFYPTRHHFDFLGAPRFPWLPAIRPYFKPTLDSEWAPVMRRIAGDLTTD